MWFFPHFVYNMKKEILDLGFIEYPRYSIKGWTCYSVHKFMWVFINDDETIIKADPEDRVSFSIEEVKDLLNWIKSKP